MQPDQSNRLTVSYLLWLLGFVGFFGAHRLYNGKIGSGLLWVCTLGLFGFGQFVDLFLVPDMAKEQQLKLMARSGINPYGIPSSPTSVAAETVKPPTQDELMVKLALAAQQHGGKLSVTQAVLATGLGFSDVETLLKEMMRKGYVSIDNDHATGIVIYCFDELA
jgi:TM2 domain-containing membrane protein YozV